MQKASTIAVIGGGFCGTATVIQLIRNATSPLNILLFNYKYPLAKGIAFSTDKSHYLLNVPAGKMSLFPDEPDHFVKWLKKYKNPPQENNVNEKYVPRSYYGQYLNDAFKQAQHNIPENVTLQIIEEEVTDISYNGVAKVYIKNNFLNADKVILATGNFLPASPKVSNKNVLLSDKYFGNPWSAESVKNIEPNKNILIIGTGLTMVDTVLDLLENNFKANIYAVSTNGYFPLSHKVRKPYTQILDEIKPPYTFIGLYKIFIKHIRKVLAQGISGEAVVDAVRPKTQEIWTALALAEKKQFLIHGRHLWGVARHRLPQEVFDRIQKEIKTGKLKIIAGRIIDLVEEGNFIKAVVKLRKEQTITSLTAQRVINCTGPQIDINKVESALIKNLIKKEFIGCDPLKLGMNATAEGTIIGYDNKRSEFLYTIGSSLKGILWETTAVPELSIQAERLAKKLIEQLKSESSSMVRVSVR